MSQDKYDDFWNKTQSDSDYWLECMKQAVEWFFESLVMFIRISARKK